MTLHNILKSVSISRFIKCVFFSSSVISTLARPTRKTHSVASISSDIALTMGLLNAAHQLACKKLITCRQCSKGDVGVLTSKVTALPSERSSRLKILRAVGQANQWDWMHWHGRLQVQAVVLAQI